MTQIGLRVSGMKIQLTSLQTCPLEDGFAVEHQRGNVFRIEAHEDEDERVESDHVANQMRNGETGEMAFEPVEQSHRTGLSTFNAQPSTSKFSAASLVCARNG